MDLEGLAQRDSRSRPGLLTCGDPHPWETRHDLWRVVALPLADLRPAPQLARSTEPRIIVQGHRAARPTPQGRRTPQSPSETSPNGPTEPCSRAAAKSRWMGVEL